VELYLIRHAEALPVGSNGIVEDEHRPLSEAGLAQCRALAEALRRQGVKLDKVVSSPLARAHETAETLVQDWPAPAPELVQCQALAPGGKRRKLTRFLHGLGAESMAVVGHNPDLSEYAGWLIGGKGVQVELAKAGVACVHFEGKYGKGCGLLNWLVTPEWFATPLPAKGSRS
jgi:phosphohistidine phosphatase